MDAGSSTGESNSRKTTKLLESLFEGVQIRSHGRDPIGLECLLYILHFVSAHVRHGKRNANGITVGAMRHNIKTGSLSA